MTKKKFLWTKLDSPLSLLDVAKIDKTENSFDIEDEDEQDLNLGPQSDFYTLQINFRLTKEILEVISTIAGIEMIKPVSQYQLIFGFPSSGFFDTESIQKDIEKAILLIDKVIDEQINIAVEQMFGDKITNTFIEIRDSLYDNKEKWIIYVYPNGQFEIITDIPNDKQYVTSLTKISRLHQLIGGLYTSSSVYDYS